MGSAVAVVRWWRLGPWHATRGVATGNSGSAGTAAGTAAGPTEPDPAAGHGVRRHEGKATYRSRHEKTTVDGCEDLLGG